MSKRQRLQAVYLPPSQQELEEGLAREARMFTRKLFLDYGECRQATIGRLTMAVQNVTAEGLSDRLSWFDVLYKDAAQAEVYELALSRIWKEEGDVLKALSDLLQYARREVSVRSFHVESSSSVTDTFLSRCRLSAWARFVESLEALDGLRSEAAMKVRCTFCGTVAEFPRRTP